ncbi:TetR/AcrR family transcriptional regulator [Corticicoccus populi]|uniref:TetR/AcrR family transcriptional regulator n=1 Tax=Corticicoccus populi TaxID=1812821 RepID=A0ABW5WWR3_9STAP
MDKREEIMQAAIHLFSEKGYASTSVQEIAHECKISKGTLYNFFDSKEALLIEVIQYNYKKMLRQAENLNLDDTLPKKEKLVQKIVVQFVGIRENKDYMHMLLSALPPHDNPEILLMMKRNQFTMMNWYKECLIEAYGSKVKPYIWDLALMLQGIMKEYATLIFRDQKDMSFEDVARFIVARFDTIVEGPADIKPVLTTEEMEEYISFKTEIKSRSPEEQMLDLLDELRRKAPGTEASLEHEEYVSAVNALEQELEKETPKLFLIKALFLYLNALDINRGLMKQLEKLLKAMKRL